MSSQSMVYYFSVGDWMCLYNDSFGFYYFLFTVFILNNIICGTLGLVMDLLQDLLLMPTMKLEHVAQLAMVIS